MGIYFELSQLNRLLEPPDKTIEVGYMPENPAAHFGCRLGITYLSSGSLRHILDEHRDVQLMDLLCLPMMLRDGVWIADRPRNAVVVYDHPDTKKRYKTAIKVTGDGFEPYITTFHRCGNRQLESILRRGRML